MTTGQAGQAISDVPISLWLWIAGVFLQTIIFTAAGTWWVGKEIRGERKEVDHSIALLENDTRRQIDNAENASRQAQDSFSRVYVKDVTDLRAQFYELGLHVRDVYTPTKSFERVTDEIKALLRDGLKRLEDRLDKD